MVFAKIETMPPAAPGSLGAEKHANLLAYLMSQNQLIASATPLPSDIDRLRTMLLPGATGGPSGGLSPNAVSATGVHFQRELRGLDRLEFDGNAVVVAEPEHVRFVGRRQHSRAQLAQARGQRGPIEGATLIAK